MTKLLQLIIISIIMCSCSNYYDGPKSDHFDGKKFFDPEQQYQRGLIKFIKWRLTKESIKWPEKIEVEKYDKPPARILGDDLRVSNVGHVTFLIQTQGLNILTDPVWSERASPVSFIGPKRVIEPGIKFEDLPPIDVVWISHNHYDHLDVTTIKNLWDKHKPRIITPLGNDTIINSYYKDIKVEAYDWGDKVEIRNNVYFHLSAMQHWSARGVFDTNKALWAALTIETNGGNIYFIGDSGYGNGRYFKKDKETFGPYRLALLPMGAFKPRWFMQYAHMDPEQMLFAYQDLGEPYTVPSHYDVFKLTDEGVGEAKKELLNAKEKHKSGENINILKVGQHWFVPK